MAPEATGAHRFRARGALGAGALTAVALTYVGLHDPHAPGSLFPPCPFRLLTGWYCPACGGLRMTHDVLHGDIAAAVTDNAYLLIGLPALAVWLLWCRRTGRTAFTALSGAVMVVSAIAWAIVRNLPGFPLVPTLLSS